MGLRLYGYRYSVYVRIARLVLAEKGLAYDDTEVNPFADTVPATYRQLHPFVRVPTLVHDDFVLYETGAITRYLDEAFEGPALQPGTPRARARLTQILSVIDAYGYWPMVRQVFAERVFGPRIGRVTDETVIPTGLDASRRVLGALDALADPTGPFLLGPALSLADCHLAPMIAYLCAAPEGQALLPAYPALQRWWTGMAARPTLIQTDPGLPGDTPEG